MTINKYVYFQLLFNVYIHEYIEYGFELEWQFQWSQQEIPTSPIYIGLQLSSKKDFGISEQTHTLCH